MAAMEEKRTFGFVLTKAPLESGLVEAALGTAAASMERGEAVGIFLISDGVWLAKRGARNPASVLFTDLLERGAAATASGDHLAAAGIASADVIEGVEVTDSPYPSLVEHVMERWDRVVVI